MSFPEFETERLFLKNITSGDKELIFNLFSNAAVNRYLYDEVPISTMDEAAAIIEKYWLIRLKSTFDKNMDMGSNRDSTKNLR